jgi:hypothetical protein
LRNAVAVMVMTLAFVPAASAQVTDDEVRAEDAIRQAVAAYGTAWNAADARTLSELYTVGADYTGFGAL